jgi:NAD(P)-dependent dehydrogenase (short-subunit alcohol dehydrogenase family)
VFVGAFELPIFPTPSSEDEGHIDLNDKVAAVTGAGSGTGRAIARRLGAEGCAVVAGDIEEATGLETVRLIERAGGRGVFVRADVRLDGDCEALIAMAERAFGGLDILVNCAGGTPSPHFPESDVTHWSATLELNLRGPMVATQAALEAMRKRSGGAVVNIASTAGLGFRPYISPEYGAAKAGLIRFTASLAGLRERMNVRVNCLVPDWILTDRAAGELAAMDPDERSQTPALLALDDVVDAVIALLVDDDLAGRVMVMRRERPPYLIDPTREE